MAPSSEVVVEQRRRYARVPARGAASLHPVPGDPLQHEDAAAEEAEQPVGGLLVDLSEGGVAVSVPVGSWLQLGRLARAGFELDGAPVVQAGQVVRSLPSLDPERVEVVVAFGEPVAAADRLRRYVMQTQIKQRARGDR
nr:PilZ domain-containing protein [Kineococcus vitellinus]